MKNIKVITYIEEVAGEAFYHVIESNEVLHDRGLLELALGGTEVVISDEVAYDYGNIELSYVEVAHDYSGEDKVIDVYKHFVIIDVNETEVNYSDKFLKTYKQEKSALKFAETLNGVMIKNQFG